MNRLIGGLQHQLNKLTAPFTYVGHRVDDPHWGVWIDLGKLHAAEEDGSLIQATHPNVKTRATYILEVGDRIRLWRRKGLELLWEAA
jgi:hypothetical protein